MLSKKMKEHRSSLIATAILLIIMSTAWHMHISEVERKISQASQHGAGTPVSTTENVACEPSGVQSLQLSAAERRLVSMREKINTTEIWMGSAEVSIILSYLASTSTYLEWGSGGSTSNFPQFAQSRAISIEHNVGWCEKMRAKIANMQSLAHLEYICQVVEDRGISKHEGSNSCQRFDGAYPQFKQYVDAVDAMGDVLYDMILIDGRARVDCAIKSLALIRSDSVVVLHDASRIVGGCYNDVLKYYDAIDLYTGKGKQGVAVLRRKPQFASLQGNHTAVAHMLHQRYA